MVEAALRPAGPYSLRLTARTDAWQRRLPDGRWAGARQRPDGIVVVRASCERAVAEARFVLALDDDTSEFHRRFARDPLLGPSVRMLRGLRPRRTATVAHAVGLTTVGWALGLMVAALALLAAATGLCVGCEMYKIGARLRGIRAGHITQVDLAEIGAERHEGELVVQFTHPLCTDCHTLEDELRSAGSRLVTGAGATMQDIVTAVVRVSDIIGEISSATAEQSRGLEEVSAAMQGLDQMTQQNAALVEESAAASESLSEQAMGLAEAVSAFKVADGATAAREPAAARPGPEAAGALAYA